MNFLLPRVAGAATILGAALLTGGLTGCGMAASPQPPSLALPKPIHDFAAARVGNRVNLTWNSPSETTDRLKIKGEVRFRICRAAKVPCEPVATIAAMPGKPGSYADTLPASLVTGPLRAITYEIFGLNKHGRSAGPSNPAAVLAGEAPPAIQNFSATVTARGAALHWQPMVSPQPDTFVQLQRTLLNPGQPSDKTFNGLSPAGEPVEVTLRISKISGKTQPGMALDTSAEFNRKYRYVASRVVARKIGTERLEVAGLPSQPVVVLMRDIFPPAAPTGLVGVPISASMNHGTPEVDLSWSANAEPDLAQYLIYRRDAGPGLAVTQIAPENSSAPIVAPAFRDLHVQPGRSYAYSVVAVDNAGNRSPRSAEVVVTAPQS